ncbi:hypothetical protein [Kordiimonas sp. SCSIO 12610]|uniref:hypothetical protein n=1 Tax=Kordiimonas sp. SCSIO 12610 TaxID=2829597 RepID=UPI00210B749B|nr:hypothetical protein [Kordiimonas sp. SCSIO 12610]UTW53964.1 hypothetical protein KFF44_08930 [Kordiimonas sp. SCSIO 12610]
MDHVKIDRLTEFTSQFIANEGQHIDVGACKRQMSEGKAAFFSVSNNEGETIAEILLQIFGSDETDREVFVLAGAGLSNMKILERCLPVVEEFGSAFGAKKASFITNRVGLAKAMSKLVQAEIKVSWNI